MCEKGSSSPRLPAACSASPTSRSSSSCTPRWRTSMLLVNPWTLSALIAMVVAFYASARSLQLGPAIVVITFTSVTGNIVALLGGILVFHDPIGLGPPQIAARIAAFCLVILGAALLPGRLHSGAPTLVDSRCPIPAPGVAMLHQAGPRQLRGFEMRPSGNADATRHPPSIGRPSVHRATQPDGQADRPPAPFAARLARRPGARLACAGRPDRPRAVGHRVRRDRQVAEPRAPMVAGGGARAERALDVPTRRLLAGGAPRGAAGPQTPMGRRGARHDDRRADIGARPRPCW